jgi:hypothetical protein
MQQEASTATVHTCNLIDGTAKARKGTQKECQNKVWQLLCNPAGQRQTQPHLQDQQGPSMPSSSM